MNNKHTRVENLQGKEKLNRIKELAGIVTENKETQKNNDYSFVKVGPDGKVYGIFKENINYYIKIANQKENLTEGDFKYIGGLSQSFREKHSSYAEALKRLNIIFGSLNESYGINGGTNLFREDDKKYVLNLPSKEKETPEPTEPQENDEMPDYSEEDFNDMAKEPSDESEDYQPDDAERMDHESDVEDGGDGSDIIKDIQKTTGKLGQELRMGKEDIDDKMIKYVINSVLSALDINKLSEEDKEEISERIKNQEESEESEDPEYSDEQQESEPEGEEEERTPNPAERRIGESVNKLMSKYIDIKNNTKVINEAYTFEQEIGIKNLLEWSDNSGVFLKLQKEIKNNIIFVSSKKNRYMVTIDGQIISKNKLNENKQIISESAFRRNLI